MSNHSLLVNQIYFSTILIIQSINPNSPINPNYPITRNYPFNPYHPITPNYPINSIFLIHPKSPNIPNHPNNSYLYNQFYSSPILTSDIVEGQRNYKSKIKKKIRKKCPSMASYFALSSYPELMVYTQTYMFTKLN